MEVTAIEKTNLIRDMRSRMEDISVEISWRELANQYFGKSSSWLYHKLDGVDGKGRPGQDTSRRPGQARIEHYPRLGAAVAA